MDGSLKLSQLFSYIVTYYIYSWSSSNPSHPVVNCFVVVLAEQKAADEEGDDEGCALV